MTNIHQLHNPWRTKEDMAKHLGVSKRTVYEMYRRGELERKTLPGGKVEGCITEKGVSVESTRG